MNKKILFQKIIFFSALLILTSIFSSCVLTPKDTSPQIELKDAESILSCMTTEQKIAQLFIITPEQLTKSCVKSVPNKYYKDFEKCPVGGFILFYKNIKNPKQLKKFTSRLKNVSVVPPILAVDEEGGRVARLARSKHFSLPKYNSMQAVGETGLSQNAFSAGQTIGGYLCDYGFDLDFAPVCDVNTNPENIVIGDRAFGSNPVLVSEMSGAFLDGLHSKRIKGCLKHFPGHGDTKGDTHLDYVSVIKDWEELKTCELIPFVDNLKQADCVMVAHVTCLAIDDEVPVSFSYELITAKLRQELDYQGVIVTDGLNMGAIEKNYGSGEACVLAFEAGNDILLMPNDFNAAYKAVLSAVQSNRISMSRLDQSVLRILKLKGF